MSDIDEFSFDSISRYCENDKRKLIESKLEHLPYENNYPNQTELNEYTNQKEPPEELFKHEIPPISKNTSNFQPLNVFEEKKSTACETCYEPQLYKFAEIKQKLEKYPEIYDIFVETKLIKEEQERMQYFQKYRKRKGDNSKEEEKYDGQGQKKRGRKEKDSNKKGDHDKNAGDNIIKKTKRNLLMECLNNVNKIIEKEGKNNILRKLAYSYTNDLKRDSELMLLDSPLKDVFSRNISTKYRNPNIISNERIMESFCKGGVQYNPIIDEVLSIPFKEWLNIYTMKKEEINSDPTLTKIKENMPELSSLLTKIKEDYPGDNEYLSNFIFYLFNYERWFYIKIGKMTKKEKNDQ